MSDDALPAVSATLHSPPRRVAVVETSYIGDVIFTGVLPLALRRAWPEVQVVLVARPGPAQLAAGLGYSSALTWDKRGDERGLKGIDAAAARLQQLAPDVLIVPHRSARSALLARRSLVPRRIGYAGPRLGVPLSGPLARWAFSHTVPFAKQGSTYTSRLLDLLGPLGVTGVDRQPHYRPSVAAKTQATDFLLDAGLGERQLVVLAPASVWPTKRWPERRYAQLAESLAVRGLIPLVLGAEEDRWLYEAMAAEMAHPELLLDGMGTSLDMAAELMRRAAVLVAGDTGLLHLGLAVGARAVALFGPTDPAQHEWPQGRLRLVQEQLPCMPCSPHGSLVCPEKHHRCMLGLAPEKVATAVLDLLERQP